MREERGVSERQPGEEALDVWSYQAHWRTSQSAHLGGVYSFGQKQLSNFTTSRKALGWWITLGTTALFQRIGMRFLAAKVFFKSHCFLWLPPSHKRLCRWEWPIQKQCKTPFLQLYKSHLNFSNFSFFCTVFLRTSDGVAILYQGACHFWFKALYTIE